MKKLIKIDFDNTTRERKTEDSYSELYSYDKNNGSFEFEILNDTLTTEQVIALFKFTESNKIWKTTGTVEGNKVNVTFDTSLITQNETVICYLYFDEEQRTSDTFRFKFKVKVSEIDKMNRYEVKERFINNTVIVDRLDVVTKDELKETLKNVGGIATEGLLTEVKAEETYAKKSEAVDNTNFELVKNRILALELKTDKDTVYDDSELKGRISVLEAKEDNNTIYDDTNVRERLTALESKPNVDVNNLVTKDELASKNYLTEHQDTSNFALKSEIPQQYNDTEVKERLTTLENKPPVDLSGYATKEELRNVSGSQPAVDNLVTKEELENKHYISDVSNLATKDELQEVKNSQPTVDTSNLVTKDELESKGYIKDLSEYAKKSELYNDSDLKARVEVLEQKTDKDSVYDDTQLKERVTALESKAIEGGAYDDKPIRDRLDVLEAKHDNDTIYDDTEVKRRLTELEGKPVLDTSVFITEEKLNNKGYLTQHQSLENVVTKEELESKHYVTEEELNNKAYLTSHQDLTPYALKSEIPQPYNDSLLTDRVTALESKAIEGGAYDDSDLRNRVVALEGKEDKDTKYDDTDLKNRVTTLENKPPLDTSEFVTNQALESKGYIKDVSNLVTKDELENKHYLTQHQPLDNLVTKEELNSKGYVTGEELNSKGYLTEHQNISHLVTNDELNSKGYITEEVLNGKNYLTEDVLNTKNYLTQHQDLSSLVTKQELENKHYLTEHQPLTHLATTSDLEALRNIAVSKSELSKKVDTTEYNTFKNTVVTKDELAGKNYLTEHQNLDGYVKKSELGTSQTNQTLSLNNNTLSISGGNSVELPVNRYEIHGTGMPNGVVEAEIGTTYVDKNKTNGALKWIKTTDGGNQGWEVLIGDTGWRTLNSTSKLKVGDRTAYIKIRRVNNLVTYQFGGLQWGWFGIIRRNGAGFLKHNSSGDKGAKVLGVSGIPEGFRSESSLIGGIYSDTGKSYGIWYLGGKSDSNFIQFTFNDPIPTDRDIGDIRVSAISYLTEEPWPTQLP